LEKDTIAPVADLAGMPTGTSSATSVDITVSSAALDFSGYKFKIGEGATTDCANTSGYQTAVSILNHISTSLSNYVDGQLKYVLWPLDGAGNTQTTATETSWTKDTTAPIAHLLSAPSGSVALSALNVTVDNLNPSDIVSYKYKIISNTTDLSLCTDATGYSASIPVATKITDDLTTYPHENNFVLCVIGKMQLEMNKV